MQTPEYNDYNYLILLNMRKNIVYFRVSTQDQDLDKNKADILHFANEKDLGKIEFVEEKISGTVSWKKRKIADVLGPCSGYVHIPPQT